MILGIFGVPRILITDLEPVVVIVFDITGYIEVRVWCYDHVDVFHVSHVVRLIEQAVNVMLSTDCWRIEACGLIISAGKGTSPTRYWKPWTYISVGIATPIFISKSLKVPRRHLWLTKRD